MSRRSDRRRAARYSLAVPVSREDVEVLAVALRAVDVIMMMRFWAHEGYSPAIRHARAVRHSAGNAAAHQHLVIPVLVTDLPLYEHWLGLMRQHQADGQVTDDFEQLIGKIRSLSETAEKHSWRAEPDILGLRWSGPVPELEGS